MVCFDMWTWETVGLTLVLVTVIFAFGLAIGRRGVRFSRTR